MSNIEPLPGPWCEAVIRILSKGGPAQIRWTVRAQRDWQQFGMTQSAYALLATTLRHPGIWGERVPGMVPAVPSRHITDLPVVYGFLCPHPLGSPKPLYAKLGLYNDQITLDLFSLHIDLTGALAERIAKAQKRKS